MAVLCGCLKTNKSGINKFSLFPLASHLKFLPAKLDILERKRFHHIDLMRSTAIVIMLFANALPNISGFICPPFLRIICSLAAPTFIFLSGYTAGLNDKKERLSALLNAAGILTAAVLIDLLVWHIRPFSQFDVLYLISTGLVINIFTRGRGYFQLFAGLILLMGGPVFAGHFPYRFEMESSAALQVNGFEDFFRRFFLDGWFPVLPWLGFSLLGYAAWKFREYSEKYLLIGLGVGLIAFILMVLFTLNSRLSGFRGGYAELFYPPSLHVMFLALSWLCLVYHLFQLVQLRFPAIVSGGYLTLPGRHSLLIYNLHAIFLGPVMRISGFQPEGFQGAVITFLILSFSCLALAGISEHPDIKKQIRKLPVFLRGVTGL